MAAALHKPRSEAQRRDHSSPVGLWVQPAQASLRARLVLWGRRAVGACGVVLDAMRAAGRLGIADVAGRARFQLEVTPEFNGRLGEWIQRTALPPSVNTLAIEFASPTDIGELDLTALVGNAAHDLVQWDLEDRGDSVHLGKRGCDALADEARTRAAAALRGVVAEAGCLAGQDLGERVSATNRRPYRLHGSTGFVVLGGELEPALPWLSVVALRGAGGRKSCGLGEVRLWQPLT